MIIRVSLGFMIHKIYVNFVNVVPITTVRNEPTTIFELLIDMMCFE